MKPGVSPVTFWLVRRIVPLHWRESFLGDLVEEITRRHAAKRPSGLIWQIFVVLTSGLRLAMDERFPFRAPRRYPRRGLWEIVNADAIYAIRGLRRNPGFTAIAVATLAVGIGANAAVFTIANWVVYRPLPGVGDPATVVTIHHLTAKDGRSALSVRDAEMLAAGAPSLAGLAAAAAIPTAVDVGIDGGASSRTRTEFVTPNYFGVLRVPLTGRTFTSEENESPSSALVAVVSERFSSKFFAGAGAIGRTVRVSGAPVTIVGVTGARFQGTRRTEVIDIWMPVSQRYLSLPPGAPRSQTGGPDTYSLFGLIGRLRAPGTPDLVREQLLATEAAYNASHPEARRFATSQVTVTHDLEHFASKNDQIRQVFLILLAVASLLLVLACANVSNAMLARSIGRKAEMATRLAIGASRLALARLVLVESLLLAGGAGIVSMITALVAARALGDTAILPFFAIPTDVRPDWRVLVAGTALSLVAAVCTGLAPIWSVRRADVAAALQQAGRGASGGARPTFRRAMMAAQVAASLVLLVGAALLLRSVHAKLSIDPGFDAARLLTFSLDPRATDSTQAATLRQAIVDRMRRVPGVERASLAFSPPFYSGVYAILRFHLDGQSTKDDVTAAMNSVEDGFFDALGLSFVDGRDFTEQELRASAPYQSGPLVLTETMARRVFGSTKAAGRSVISWTGDPRLVVGVVRDTRQRMLTATDARDIVFQPYRATYTSPYVTVLARLSRSPASVMPGVRRAVQEIDPSMSVFDVRTADEGIRAEFGDEVLASRLALVFAVLATIVASLGLYGVLARSLAERRHELAIRAALGASPREMVRVLAVEIVGVTGTGLFVGLVSSTWLSRFLEHLLFEVTHRDVVSFVAAAAIVVTAMTLASVPACLRARRIVPAETLGTDV